MAGITYKDFVLLVERDGDTYCVRVDASPEGRCLPLRFKVPPTVSQFQAWGPPLPRDARPVAQETGTSTQADVGEQALKDFGRKLFEMIFAGEIGRLLERCMGGLLDDAGLRIVLRLTDVPELAAIPWEYLYYPGKSRFMALQKTTPVVRHLDTPTRLSPMAVKPPLRVLVAIASPTSLQVLDVEEEYTRLKSALSDLEADSRVIVERLERVTVSRLRDRLRDNGYHVLHFIGHGDFDRATGRGFLLFEGDGGPASEPRRVNGEEMGLMFDDLRPPRLVMLNSCSGARGATNDVFVGMAQTLVQGGIAAVIAMQYPVSDRTAITFSSAFYKDLTGNEPVDSALCSGRKAVYLDSSKVEWATPVLFLDTSDARLFDIKPRSDDEWADILRSRARNADKDKNWDVAVQQWERYRKLRPNDMEAEAQLDKARAKLRIDPLYAEGVQLMCDQRWQEAYDRFAQVNEIERNYKSVHISMTQCKVHLQLQQPQVGVGQRANPQSPDAAGQLDSIYQPIVQELTEGEVILFLGPDVNRAFRTPEDATWQPGGKYAPCPDELAAVLAARLPNRAYPEGPELARVSQDIFIIKGKVVQVYKQLHDVLSTEFPPTPVHTLAASLRPPQIIISTGYDTMLERALKEKGVPFDTIWYCAEGESSGKFIHRTTAGEEQPIDQPNNYRGLSLKDRVVVLKLHGAKNPDDYNQDSYAIIEDHYLDYAHQQLAPLPTVLTQKLEDCSVLFLGCGRMRWNPRAIFRRIWSSATQMTNSWAVPLNPDQIDETERRYWQSWNIEVVGVQLREFVDELSARLQAVKG